jgi:diguanylate cyclase (GGDEF)-like protein
VPTLPRITIGVLAGWQVYERTTPNWFLEAVLRGAAEGGRALGCDVLLACGIHSRIDDPKLAHPAWPAPGEHEDFVPVGSWDTDGLILVSPLRSPARCAYARALQEHGFPVVFVGSGDGRPAVVADSAAGFRHALEHLRGHGHRRVAFVAGDPLDEGDSRQRLTDFVRLREELGLDESDELVAPGLHSEQGGYEAMVAILRAGRPFSAVFASNDTSAVGALRALSEAGRRVPQDVAVVGFDDQPLASAHVPPLATVRYPLVEAGRRAAELLVDLIRAGRRPPDLTLVPTRLLARRSCGCLGGPLEPTEETEVMARAGEDVTGARVAEAVSRAGSPLRREAALTLGAQLAAGFEKSRREAAPSAFAGALADLLQQVEWGGDRAHRWQAALALLRRGLPADLPVRARIEAEDLLELGRVALSESADRQERRRRLQDSLQADRVSALTVPLQSAQDEREVLRLLVEHAPALGVRPVAIAAYEDGDEDEPFTWSRVQFLEGGASVEPGPPDRLRTRRILRDHLPPADGARALAVLPLTRQGRALGFLAVEAASLASGAAVARQLAVALESVRLQAAVRALTVIDDLTGLRNRRFFESELQREVERARRFDRDVALVLVDVDHFKSYNDSFGHRAGDEALRRLAGCLGEAVARRLDAVTRYGGEEFAILLPETNAEGARHVAERVREAVRACPALRMPLTVSAGVAAHRGAGGDRESLVLRADAALYRAKHEGRDRVRVA